MIAFTASRFTTHAALDNGRRAPTVALTRLCRGMASRTRVPSWMQSSHFTRQRIDGQHAVSKGLPCTPACSVLHAQPPGLVSALLAVVAPADESHVPGSQLIAELRERGGRRADEGGGSRREGEDELHLIQTRPNGSVTTRCTERLVTAI